MQLTKTSWHLSYFVLQSYKLCLSNGCATFLGNLVHFCAQNNTFGEIAIWAQSVTWEKWEYSSSPHRFVGWNSEKSGLENIPEWEGCNRLKIKALSCCSIQNPTLFPIAICKGEENTLEAHPAMTMSSYLKRGPTFGAVYTCANACTNRRTIWRTISMQFSQIVIRFFFLHQWEPYVYTF